MKIAISFALSKREMEALEGGMLNHATLLKEPLETLCPGQTDSVLQAISEFFKREVTKESTGIGRNWNSIFSLIFRGKYLLSYEIEVSDVVLINGIDTAVNITTDVVPILSMYAKLIKAVTGFEYSAKTKNSFKALGDCLRLN